MKIIFKSINIFFSIGLVFIASGVAYVAIPYFGNQALIVRSGSMSPAIDAGSIVVVRPDNKFISPIPFTSIYNEGDIIAFRSENNPKTIITHRIVGIEAEKNGIFYKTKGDANKSVDGWLVNEQNILGKTFFTLPFAGRLLAFTKSNIGFPLLVILPALMVILLEIRAIYKEIRRQKVLFQTQLSSNVSVTTLKVLLPIFIFMTIFVFGSTSAFFSDSETSVSNTFTAAEIFPGGPGSVVINEIMWMGSQGNSADEWIELRNMTSSPIDISGWVLTDIGPGADDITIPAGKIIPANGFFIVANDTEPNSVMSVTPDHVVNLSMNNTGEQIILQTSLAVTIDTADNDGGDWFAGENPGGQNPKKSMERNLIPGDGTVSTNWHTATTQVNIDAGKGELATPKAANGL